MRVVDFIIEYFLKRGIDTYFCVVGGGSMYMNDALRKYQDKINVTFFHHEQSAAFAAEAYTKLTKKPSVCMVTSGCGLTNTITGILSCYQDNVSVIFISGQVHTNQTITKYFGEHKDMLPRQIGVQETDTINLTSSITKYNCFVSRPNMVERWLDTAITIATVGNPGPVHLDVPLDVQRANIDKSVFFKIPTYKNKVIKRDFDEKCDKLTKLFKEAKRPVILVGNGVKLANAEELLEKFMSKFNNIPIFTTFMAADLPIWYNCGTIGIKGNKTNNEIIQKADLILAIGTRLSLATIGYNRENLGNAKLVIVDISRQNHYHRKYVPNLFFNCGAKHFLDNFKIPGECNDRIYKYRFGLMWVGIFHLINRIKTKLYYGKFKGKNKIDLIDLVDKISRKCDGNAVVLADAGGSFFAAGKQFISFKNQRLLLPGSQAIMGWTIPASIGASVGDKNRQVVGLVGDGSLQFNIQELQVIKHHKLPIKLFVINNGGYLSIKNTAKNYFSGKVIGTDEDSGISFPSVKKIAKAYGIKYCKIDKERQLSHKVDKVLNCMGAVICEVMCDPEQMFEG